MHLGWQFMLLYTFNEQFTKVVLRSDKLKDAQGISCNSLAQAYRMIRDSDTMDHIIWHSFGECKQKFEVFLFQIDTDFSNLIFTLSLLNRSGHLVLDIDIMRSYLMHIEKVNNVVIVLVKLLTHITFWKYDVHM